MGPVFASTTPTARCVHNGGVGSGSGAVTVCRRRNSRTDKFVCFVSFVSCIFVFRKLNKFDHPPELSRFTGIKPVYGYLRVSLQSPRIKEVVCYAYARMHMRLRIGTSLIPVDTRDTRKINLFIFFSLRKSEFIFLFFFPVGQNHPFVYFLFFVVFSL